MSNFRCFECDQPARDAHHVVPKSLGGKRTVPLCNRCHDKIHGGSRLKRSELIKEGLRKAKKEGRPYTRPRIYDHKLIKILRELGYPYSFISAITGTSARYARKIINGR